MKKQDWIWMPHAAHFIMANRCEFHLATYVGGYIVSTVGELMPDETVREIHAEVYGIKLEGRGEARERDFRKKCGFMEVGLHRLYETTVFRAEPNDAQKCCPFTIESPKSVDFRGYNTADDATAGHYDLCTEYSQREET